MSLPDWDDADLDAAAPYLNAAIAANNLDGALVYGLVDQESHFKPMAFLMDRNGGSYGLMQMSLPTAQGLGYQGDAGGLYDPATNAALGCALLAQLLQQFGGDESSALAAYNAGPNNLPAGAPYAAAVLAKADYFAQLFASQDDASGATAPDQASGISVGTIAVLTGLAALAIAVTVRNS